MHHKSFIARWPDGTISVVGAASFQELMIQLDAYGDPAIVSITEIEQGVHFHLKPKHKKVEPLEGDEAVWWSLQEAEWLFADAEPRVHWNN